MGIYQGLSEYKPDAQASASILAYTRLRFGLVLVRNYLPLALHFGAGYWLKYILDMRVSNTVTPGRPCIARLP